MREAASLRGPHRFAFRHPRPERSRRAGFLRSPLRSRGLTRFARSLNWRPNNALPSAGQLLSSLRSQPFGGGGIRNVFLTYSMLARVSATMSLVGDPVSRTYQPR